MSLAGDRGKRVTRKGIYYWPSYDAARAWAHANGWPEDRILFFSYGWAVQFRVSGPYAGPAR